MEVIWALGRIIRGNRLQTIPLLNDDDTESTSGQSTVTSHHVASLVYSRRSHCSASASRGPYGALRLRAHQRQSTLGMLPADVLQAVLHWLTEWELLRALGICQEWRALLEEDDALNRLFWQQEVLRYQKDARIMNQNERIHAHYFGIRPPPVHESLMFCMLRLKKLHEVAERRRFYSEVDDAEKAPVARSQRCCMLAFRMLLLDFLHGRDLGCYIPAAAIGQGCLVMIWVAFQPPGIMALWLTPAWIASALWVITSAADMVLLLGRYCSQLLRRLDTRLWQTRWVTVSRHPTLNRLTLFGLAALWVAFLALFAERLQRTSGDGRHDRPYWECFMPLFAGCFFALCILLVEFRMQRSIYFELDAGYAFVEPEILSEAEQQAQATWRHLVWPRIAIVITGALFFVLLLHRVEPLPGWTHKLPWSVVFVPLYVCIGFVFAHLYRFERFTTRNRAHRATLVWVLVCVIIFFAILGMDLDVSELLDFSTDNLIVPVWAVGVPLWASALAPLTRLCD
eukprot:TRINITY_DN9586_c0_g1_i1.p1 TRINITY_DN9586_c0_g1~~TRINITY_DN9586_c0_g1_i1.p1  ORF type:complete len:539 (+),score=181.61 TRINITY_DN9586_c0_g1_i1:84-1619(+)